MLYIQVITTNCFKEPVSLKPTRTFGPAAPYGNELHNLISYGVDSQFLLGNLIRVPLFFPLQKVRILVPEHLSPCCSCSTTPFLQQQSWPKDIREHFALSANVFVVLIALFPRSLMNTLNCRGPSPRPRKAQRQPPCSSETSHLLLSFGSHLKTNYLALRGDFLLARDTGEEPPARVCLCLSQWSQKLAFSWKTGKDYQEKTLSTIKYSKIIYRFFFFFIILTSSSVFSTLRCWCW